MMNSKPIFDPGALVRPTPAETRAAAQRMEQERLDARRLALGEQVSMHNSAKERIHLWEQLHALDLPEQSSMDLNGTACHAAAGFPVTPQLP